MLASTHDQESSRAEVEDDKLDTSAAVAGGRGRPPADVEKKMNGPLS